MSAEVSIAGIDHVAFAAVRLESAREGFERLGFALTARGYCTWCTPPGERSAGSHSVIFDRCYLDMIEHDERRWRAYVASSALYRCGLAPFAIVLRAHAVEEVAQRLAEQQIGCLAPYDIVRTFDDRPDQPLRYRLLALDRAAAGGLPLAFVHDQQPIGMRRAEWLLHPNAATNLARVTVRVPELGSTRRALNAIISAASQEPAGTSDVDGPVLDLVDDAGDAYLAAVGALVSGSHRPALLALTFWSDLNATVEALQRNGVRWMELPGARIAIEPEEGVGCGIVFAARRPAAGRRR